MAVMLRKRKAILEGFKQVESRADFINPSHMLTKERERVQISSCCIAINPEGPNVRWREKI